MNCEFQGRMERLPQIKERLEVMYTKEPIGHWTANNGYTVYLNYKNVLCLSLNKGKL